jgi:hypothetical protein
MHKNIGRGRGFSLDRCYIIPEILFENLIKAPPIKNIISLQRTPSYRPLVPMDQIVVHDRQVTGSPERLEIRYNQRRQ